MTQVALITGAAGFCARHLVRRLRRMPDVRVIGFDRQSTAPKGAELDEYFQGDIRDAAQVSSVVRRARPDRVFHLAGMLKGSSEEIYEVNFRGGLNLLEAVRSAVPDARVLVVGSAAEYGTVVASELPVRETYQCRPESPYALSKFALTLAACDYAAREGLRVSVARPFNLIGSGIPSSLLVGALLERVKCALDDPTRTFITVGNVDTKRDFLAVEDAVDAYVQLLEIESSGEIFNICSGVPSTVRSVAEQLLALAPRTLAIEIDPALLRLTDVPVVYGSCEKAHRAFGFAAHTDLATSLRNAWQYATERE